MMLQTGRCALRTAASISGLTKQQRPLRLDSPGRKHLLFGGQPLPLPLGPHSFRPQPCEGHVRHLAGQGSQPSGWTQVSLQLLGILHLVVASGRISWPAHNLRVDRQAGAGCHGDALSGGVGKQHRNLTAVASRSASRHTALFVHLNSHCMFGQEEVVAQRCAVHVDRNAAWGKGQRGSMCRQYSQTRCQGS